MEPPKIYDAIIVGGSFAGMSAALALGRSMRKTLIIDNGHPCNRSASHSHNFLTHDGDKPAKIIAAARAEVLKYPDVKLEKSTVKDVRKGDNIFEVTTDKEERFHARKILFATGVSDTMPEIEGFPECWGVTALHCPYCHGYEAKQQRTLVLANGTPAYEVSALLTNWTKEIILLTNGKHTLSEEHLAKMKENNIEVIEKEIAAVKHKKGQLREILFRDSSSISAPVMYAKIPFKQHCSIPQQMGCELLSDGLIRVDEWQETTVPGVYAAGDSTSLARIISYAVAAGTRAGIGINTKLVAEKI